MRRVSGRTDRVVVVGAGLGGLACALHLAGAGRQVTVLEREAVPGGRAGRLSVSGYEFDTGPTVLTMPDLIAEPLEAVGERLTDWLELHRLDPAYRAHYPDGSTLDVVTEPERMAEEVARVCGPSEADGYRRFVEYARRLWQVERADFVERNLDSPTDLLTANLLRLLSMGAFGRLQAKVDQFFADPRTRRAFSFQAMYAGLAPRDALAIYAVIAYLDSVAGVYFPRGGVHAVPKALAGAAEKHGVQIRYGTTVTRVETSAGRAVAVRTGDGERIPADVVVLNPDMPVARRDLLPPERQRPLRYSPSCVVLHIGSTQEYGRIAHHNLHFGRTWEAAFDEVIRDGRLMSDPSLLVTNPSRMDPSLAPAGRQTYYVLAPVPNLAAGRDLDWRGGLGERYAAELVEVLEARGYKGFGAGVEVSHVVTPADWADQGMAAGTPFAAAHTFSQTGPFRPGNLHSTLDNVVFVGSGTQPGVGVPMVLISGKLAAQRVTGRAT
ncbi:phytoene desaturase family protein [Phytohabitans sp. ZYX-F-186]|uniref:Phytoene desaturase family protein n=1 Tax=Phytohabitans maris TaxID=3071409 RepID=A0ABU0ZEH4_9ACTN|nr:phytoene desaturase family protein [Phytohabitans sp. ZYX-F-186]MDQ7905461.1 phytoene desaturase family protein [Phytohabitans sp. ZYX-F-186]